MTCTPATPFTSRICWISSTQILRPSSPGLAAFSIRSITASGIWIPGTLSASSAPPCRWPEADARQDEDPLVEAEVADPCHEGLEPGHVEDVIGLDELGPGLDLLGQPLGPPFDGIDARIFGRPDEELRRLGDFPPRQEHAVIAHRADGADQRQRIEVEDRLRPGLVPFPHIVAGQAEHVLHPHGGRAQHVALNGDPVPVAAGDLVNRAVPHPGQQRADADGRHVAQLAPEASVALIGCATSASGFAASNTSAGSALSGDFISAVTAN